MHSWAGPTITVRPHRRAGSVFLLLGVVGIAVGGWLSSITRRGCTEDFFGDCLSYGPVQPYIVPGVALIAGGAILAIIGAILYLRETRVPLPAPRPPECRYCGKVRDYPGRCRSCGAA